MTATVAHRCALCNEAIDCDMSLVESYVTACAAHHAVCPKRPIEVRDYVRWEFPRRDRFAEGEVTAVEENRYTIRIVACSRGPWVLSGSDPAPGLEHTFHVVNDSWNQDATTIRRIPRPAEAQATAPACAPGCQCGAHATAADRITPIAHPAEREFGRYAEPEPAALIDGRDREWCLAAWMENRLAVESGAAAPNAMTRMQRDVGREMWLQRYGAQRATILRGKVVAKHEADRNQVRITPEVDPWD